MASFADGDTREKNISDSEGCEECECGHEDGDSRCCSDSNQNYFVANKNRNPNPQLPSTVTVLEDDGGNMEPGEMDVEGDDDILARGRVYVVGTAHFSKDSQEDVRKTIRETQPDVVSVELCSSRVNMLSMDEESLLREASNLTAENIFRTIKQSGAVQGMMHILLLSMSAHITKQLGMAPGGEFRTAYQESNKVPGCKFHLGDRPIQVTLQRALASLNLWQKIRLFWYIVVSHKSSISQEEVERCKQSDLLEELLREMAGEFPALSQIFVQERDQYMAYGLRTLLRNATLLKRRQNPNVADLDPVVIVSVVGIGHTPGIAKHWKGWTRNADINSLLMIPARSRTAVLFRYGMAGALCGSFAFLLYKGWNCMRRV